jgi:hypothetical protein
VGRTSADSAPRTRLPFINGRGRLNGRPSRSLPALPGATAEASSFIPLELPQPAHVALRRLARKGRRTGGWPPGPAHRSRGEGRDEPPSGGSPPKKAAGTGRGGIMAR